jgi:DNA-binding response OmpR family regulator
MAKKYRILIVDDSKETVGGLKAYLGKKYHVLTAQNGRKGIQKFAKNENRIHLVLTEIILPDTPGVRFVSSIKQEAPEKPVIAMTGWVYHLEELWTDSNVDMILQKPFEMEELDQAIEKLLSGMPIN